MSTRRQTLNNQFSNVTWIVLTIAILVFGSNDRKLAFAIQATDAQTKIMSLSVNGFSKEAKTIGANCKKNWEQIQKFVTTTDQFIKANEFDKVDVEKIGPFFSLARQIGRDARALEDMREPAGLDWTLRGKHCARVLSHAAAKLKSLEFGAEMVRDAEKLHASTFKRRSNAISKALQFLDNGQNAKAESLTNEILIAADEFYPWLTEKSGRQLFSQVNKMRLDVANALSTNRKNEATQILAAALKSATPKIDALVEAATSAAKTGSVTIEGESLTGDKALLALVTQWQTVHSNLMRAVGITLISYEEEDSKMLLGTKLGATTPEDAVNKLSKAMEEQLPKLIAADLAQTSASDTQGKYVRYLTALGRLAHRVPNSVLDGCKKEIAVLEKGSSKLATNIKNYKLATSEILMWRKRAAEAGQRAIGETLELVEAAKSIPKIQYVPVLTVPLDKVSISLNKSAINYQTHILNVEAINNKALYSSYRERTWATVTTEFDISAELDALRSDLLVTKTSPPLSADAAISLLTAKRKHLAKVGGPISKVQVEALGTRFPKLPANMSSLVPLDQFPENSNSLGDMMLRFNITPTWVQHEHFFKKL